MTYSSKGRSGTGNRCTALSWQDFEGLSSNGHQMKQEDKRYVRDLSGQAFWNMRKEDDPKFWDIKPEDYRTPAYYHQPKQAKALPKEDIDQQSVAAQPEVIILPREKKESIFLTLKDENIFRKIYEKFVK